MAGRFAYWRRASAVRLLKETNAAPTPDFELRWSGDQAKYETSEIDTPGRRRALEYRDPPETPPVLGTSLVHLLEQMKYVTAKKALKPYPSCRGLVVFINPPLFSFRAADRWEQLLEGTEAAAKAFEEVWILRDRGHLCWRNGREQSASGLDTF